MTLPCIYIHASRHSYVLDVTRIHAHTSVWISIHHSKRVDVGVKEEIGHPGRESDVDMFLRSIGRTHHTWTHCFSVILFWEWVSSFFIHRLLANLGIWLLPSGATCSVPFALYAESLSFTCYLFFYFDPCLTHSIRPDHQSFLGDAFHAAHDGVLDCPGGTIIRHYTLTRENISLSFFLLSWPDIRCSTPPHGVCIIHRKCIYSRYHCPSTKLWWAMSIFGFNRKLIGAHPSFFRAT